MDTKILFENIKEELISSWEISQTGGGFLITTDWRLPNNDRIEIYVRMVGERKDLYLVSDGGNLFNFLFSHGIDLSKDERGMKVLNGVASNYEAQIVDYQLAKGANDSDLHRAVRMILEAIKDASFILWHKMDLNTGHTH